MTTHLSDEQIEKYVTKQAAGTERDAILQHLTFCTECRARVDAQKGMLSDTKVQADTTPAATESKAPSPRRQKMPPVSEAFSGIKPPVANNATATETAKSRSWWLYGLIGIVGLIVLGAAAYAYSRGDDTTVSAPISADGVPQPIALAAAERPWLDAPGWERARVIGVSSLTDPVHVTFDDAGNSYALMIAYVGEDQHPYVVSLDSLGETRWAQVIDTLPLALPDIPKIVWDGEQLNLFWLNDRQLNFAQMDSAGNIVTAPTILSDHGDVGGYDVVVGPDNAITLWYSGTRSEPGLYAFEPGDLTGEPVRMDANGFRPSLRYDANGTLNATWLVYPQGFENTLFLYATYPNGLPQVGQETVIRNRTMGTNKRLQGPVMGVDATTAYVFWTEETTSGPSAGDIDTQYFAFPLYEPQQIGTPQKIRVPKTYEVEYADEIGGALQAGPRVDLDPLVYDATLNLIDLGTNPIPADELVLTYRATIAYLWRKTQPQIGLAYFSDGNSTGQQLITFSSGASRSPFVISDADQYLYSTWVEQNDDGHWNVYFATTRPEMKAQLAALTGADVAGISADTIFGLLAGSVLAPIAVLIWMVLPILLLFLVSRIVGGGEGKLTWGGVIVIAVFVFVYKGIQIGSLPTDSIVPFAAWIPVMADWMGNFLQTALPYIIAAIALLIAYLVTYRRGRESLLYFALIFAAIDGLAMMAVYGSWFFGAL
jgi:hypothetical protein